jgi:hypothetical protein
VTRPGPAELQARLGAAFKGRLSPEHTRRATLFERLTVQRLSWDVLVLIHRHLELIGKLATAIWVGFIARSSASPAGAFSGSCGGATSSGSARPDRESPRRGEAEPPLAVGDSVPSLVNSRGSRT